MSNRGTRLIEAMKIRGMQKQHALAYTLGVNESTVTRWKNNGAMSLDSAVALCEALDISLDWFLTGSGFMDKHATVYTDTEASAIHNEIAAELLDGLKKISMTMPKHSQYILISLINSILAR